MDPDRFLRELAARFEDFPRSELPRDVRFAEILDAVPGLARSNTLALLNAAASCLDADECYVEVGTYRGTSLISGRPPTGWGLADLVAGTVRFRLGR